MPEYLTPQHIMNLFHEEENAKKPKVNPEWSKIHFKEYPRFEKIQLEKYINKPNNLGKILRNRRAIRKLNKKVNLKNISNILYYSAGIAKGKGNKSRRMYPSGGARYPLELYLIVKNSDLESGIYHYNVIKNCLEKFPIKIKNRTIKDLFFQDFVAGSSIIIIISSVIGRSQIKYGLKALKFSFIESGHVAQNIMLNAKSMGLDTCAIAGYYGAAVEGLLGIDGFSEGVVYIVAVG